MHSMFDYQRVRLDNRGGGNGRAKLTARQVERVKKEWPTKSQSQLARELNVSATTIHRIVNGVTWI